MTPKQTRKARATRAPAAVLPSEPILATRVQLWAAEVYSIGDLSVLLDLPKKTIDVLIGRGDGPDVIVLGRRRYVLKSALREWLARVEAAKHDAPRMQRDPSSIGKRGRPRMIPVDLARAKARAPRAKAHP